MDIKLKFIYNSYLLNNYYIEIYHNNSLLIRELVLNKPYYTFKGILDNSYKVVIIGNNFCYITSFICKKNYPYTFYITNTSNKYFYVFDKNYPNLVIKKGIIKLWKKNTL